MNLQARPNMHSLPEILARITQETSDQEIIQSLEGCISECGVVCHVVHNPALSPGSHREFELQFDSTEDAIHAYTVLGKPKSLVFGSKKILIRTH